MKPFDSYEIHPCKTYTNKIVEQCDADQAQFWTLYGHTNGYGIEAIGDFKTFDDAKEIYFKITGKEYN